MTGQAPSRKKPRPMQKASEPRAAITRAKPRCDNDLCGQMVRLSRNLLLLLSVMSVQYCENIFFRSHKAGFPVNCYPLSACGPRQCYASFGDRPRWLAMPTLAPLGYLQEG